MLRELGVLLYVVADQFLFECFLLLLNCFLKPLFRRFAEDLELLDVQGFLIEVLSLLGPDFVPQ